MSYREHLAHTAAKLKSRNNLIMKLAGTSWGACASTLRTSALAPLLLSVRILLSSVGKIQLHQSHRHSTSQFHAPHIRLPALHSGIMASSPNVAPPSLCHKAASNKMLQIIQAHPNWPVYADVFEHLQYLLGLPPDAQYDQT